MVYLVYRYDHKTGKMYGPYAVRSVRVKGCDTPRQEYLGRAIVEEDGTVKILRTGEVLGHLGDLNAEPFKIVGGVK